MNPPPRPVAVSTDAVVSHRRAQLLTMYQVGAETHDLADDLAEVVDLARRMTGTETSQLNVIGADRQLTLHEAGTPTPHRTVPLPKSVCATVLDDRGADRLIVIPDTAADPLLRQHPAVTGPPGIRFYAGAPLTSTHGWPIGMLCVWSSTPRDLDETQRGLLRQLGNAAMHILERQRRTAARGSASADAPPGAGT